MKFLFSVILLVFCFIHLDSFVSAGTIGASPNPKRKPGGCYQDDTGHMRAGEEKTVTGRCWSAKCEADGSTSYLTCLRGISAPECHLSKQDLTKPYPKCCPQVVCPY